MIDEIDRENNRYKTNYEKSMFIDGTEEMSNDSFYEIYSNNKQHAEINEWI
ncbi:hypothetical protein FACS189459_1460 [Bacilli bacterium]|nr:hypothetical protein FACS189459_1460 [Bacilli bacterium]